MEALCGTAANPQSRQRLKTREEVLAEFDRRGMSIADWAKGHNLPATIVRGLLTGRVRGRRGAAHRAAVLLGIKEGMIDEVQG
ncbi:DNA-binding protein [Burkholderia sp. LMG 21824]|uniref:DNA-binding protein n=1 Tax=Burkholderia sp. LMG 21824 TaxID=3158172 RepID=UPI003C2B0C36